MAAEVVSAAEEAARATAEVVVAAVAVAEAVCGADRLIKHHETKKRNCSSHAVPFFYHVLLFISHPYHAGTGITGVVPTEMRDQPLMNVPF
jgi:hypothetical protein